MSLTKRDNGVYRPLVRAAWLVHCLRKDWDEKDKARYDVWYRQQLMQSPARLYTSKQIQRPEQLDAVCLHFATLAGLEKQIDYWSKASERRALWKINKTMTSMRVSDNYVNAIAKQMGFLSGTIANYRDLPAELILKINAALSIHAHRQAKQEEVPF